MEAAWNQLSGTVAPPGKDPDQPAALIEQLLSLKPEADLLDPHTNSFTSEALYFIHHLFFNNILYRFLKSPG